jgi:ADP-ribose diphosphatase
MIQVWEILTREPAHDFGIFQVQKKQVRSPRTGKTINVQAIRFPAWVMVLALTPDEEVILIRQYRHGVEEICLELPGGLVDGEDRSADVAVKRELLEETGYRARELTLIGDCFPQPAVLTNRCFFYLARDVERVREPELDEGEDVEILKVPLASIPARIENKEITHGMVLLAFFFYWMKKGREARE